MRRIAGFYPGEAKTDTRDAFVIADAARSMPHTLRAVEPADEAVAELEMIAGSDDDLADEATRASNRLRGLLTQIHPSLERVRGPRVQHPAVLKLLDQFGSPAQIRKTGRCCLVSLIRTKAPRMAERLVDDIVTALSEQTVVVPGTDAAALIVPSLASSLQAVLDRGKLLATRIGETAGGPPSFQDPDVHAGDRRQDRSPHPHRRRRWIRLPVRRPPGGLRQPHPGDQKLRRIGLHTPASVHFGTADQVRDQRAVALAEAFERHPERFTRRPRPPEIPTKAWINDPARRSQPEPQASY